MSTMRTQTTSMTDRTCLEDALRSLGYKPTTHAEPQKIRGHYSEMSGEKCEVVLRKEDHNRQADIGFAKQKDGTYKVLTDTYVNRDLSNLEKFTNDVKVAYAKAHTRKIARQAGFTFLGEKRLTNGTTRLQFAKSS